jgi:hypothetical protein
MVLVEVQRLIVFKNWESNFKKIKKKVSYLKVLQFLKAGFLKKLKW